MSSPPIPLPVPTPDQRRSTAEYFQHANQWLAAGHPHKAAAILLHCCRLDPANMIYRRALQTARYKSLPNRGILTGPKKWLARRRLRTAVHGSDPHSLLISADDLLALDSNDVEAHLALALGFEKAGLLENAVVFLEQARRQAGALPALTAELSRLYEMTGKYSLAQALTQPEPALAHREESRADPLAGLQSDLETLRHDAAIAEQKLADQPDDANLQSIRSRLLHEIRAREIELCRHQADRWPSNYDFQMELGAKLLQAGQFEAALEAFQRITNDTPRNWQALVYSGYCHFNLRQWHKAKAAFEHALPLLPLNAEETRQDMLRLLNQKSPTQTTSDP